MYSEGMTNQKTIRERIEELKADNGPLPLACFNRVGIYIDAETYEPIPAERPIFENLKERIIKKDVYEFRHDNQSHLKAIFFKPSFLKDEGWVEKLIQKLERAGFGKNALIHMHLVK